MEEYLRHDPVPTPPVHLSTVTGRGTPTAGEATIQFVDGEKPEKTPTEELGLPKLEPLAAEMERLYGKGSLVSIDKLGRIPPLDTPLDPKAIGDFAEIQRGIVTRKVSLRVSIIDEKTLKEIERRRKGMHSLLTQFTFGLADNMRWMPFTAKPLFEKELERINEEGQQLISELLEDDAAAYVKKRRSIIIDSIREMYRELGRQGNVPESVIEDVMKSFEKRLEKARVSAFIPKITYSTIRFDATDNKLVSPWGQAFSLLSDIAIFPRKAYTKPFFLHGLKLSRGDLLNAMNVADDTLFGNQRTSGIMDRCEDELKLISRIREANLESKERCKLVWRILTGEGVDSISAELEDSPDQPSMSDTDA